MTCYHYNYYILTNKLEERNVYVYINFSLWEITHKANGQTLTDRPKNLYIHTNHQHLCVNFIIVSKPHTITNKHIKTSKKQNKWQGHDRERERERVCVCVRERESNEIHNITLIENIGTTILWDKTIIR